MNQDSSTTIFNWFKNLRKKSRDIKKGDVGVYHDILSFKTLTEEHQPIHYDMYIKLKAVGVFEDLIEVEVIDIKVTESCNEEVVSLVKSMIPKYIKPKYINWIVND